MMMMMTTASPTMEPARIVMPRVFEVASWLICRWWLKGSQANRKSNRCSRKTWCRDHIQEIT